MKCQPTAGLEPAVLGLEVPRLIHWATRAAAAAAAAAFVHGVGFEPTSANTVDLKSTPLDLSGTLSLYYIFVALLFFYIFFSFLYI